MGLIIITPGPDSLLIVRNAANFGRKVGFASVLGVQVGVIFHTGLALIGATALLASQPILILVIGIGGAIFIGFLAWQTWTAGVLAADLKALNPITAQKAFSDALITNALNPKVILAFFAIMMPLVSRDLPRTPQILIMALSALAMNTVWQSALALGAERFFQFFTNLAVQRWINRLVALILLFLALLLPFQAVMKVQDLPAEGTALKPFSALSTD